MKAIETHYKGCRFRSRLEARWAVFFDALGVTWEYEPEGYELGGGARYLPDFWLPEPGDASRGYWCEVKPCAASSTEKEKLRALATGTGHIAYLLCGAPWGVTVSRETYAGRSEAGSLDGFVFHFTHLAGIGAAVAAARGARFEFGESGAAA